MTKTLNAVMPGGTTLQLVPESAASRTRRGALKLALPTRKGGGDTTLDVRLLDLRSQGGSTAPGATAANRTHGGDETPAWTVRVESRHPRCWSAEVGNHGRRRDALASLKTAVVNLTLELPAQAPAALDGLLPLDDGYVLDPYLRLFGLAPKRWGGVLLGLKRARYPEPSSSPLVQADPAYWRILDMLEEDLDLEAGRLTRGALTRAAAIGAFSRHRTLAIAAHLRDSRARRRELATANG